MVSSSVLPNHNIYLYFFFNKNVYLLIVKLRLKKSCSRITVNSLRLHNLVKKQTLRYEFTQQWLGFVLHPEINICGSEQLSKFYLYLIRTLVLFTLRNTIKTFSGLLGSNLSQNTHNSRVRIMDFDCFGPFFFFFKSPITNCSNFHLSVPKICLTYGRHVGGES